MMVEGALVLSDRTRPALDTLPSDIVRIIVRRVGEAGHSVHNLRLISHNWNTIAAEYIQFRLPLDTVRITGDQSVSVVVQLKFKKKGDEQHFQGACREWNTKLLPGKFYSPALRISSRMNILFSVLPFLILFGSFCLLDAHHLLIFHLAFSAQFAYWIMLKRTVHNNQKRLARVFARCSSIDELCLQYVNMQRLDVIRNALGEVTIKHLIVFEDECDEELKEAIMEMCRKHNIQKISVCVKIFKDMRLSTFIDEIAMTTPRLDIYERTTCEDIIFGLSREFWEKKEMNNERFSTKVVSRKNLRIDSAANLYREHWLRFEIDSVQNK